MKIYFARHGESEANRLHIISNRSLPHGLTPLGRKQVRVLAQSLHGRPITRIFSSPILRAVETSAIVAELLNVDVELADGLREYDCGIAEGRSDQAAWQLWQAQYDAWVFKGDYSHTIEGGESFQDVQKRFVAFLESLINAFSGTTSELVCIAHGGIYSVVFPHVMRNISPDIIKRYGFDYTSCVIAEHAPTGWMCLEWNGFSIE